MPARKATKNGACRITVSLDANDRAKLEHLASKSDRSLAWIVREAVSQYLASLSVNDTDGDDS